MARQGLAIYQEIGGQTNIADGLRVVGIVAMWGGKFAEAEQAMQAVLTIVPWPGQERNDSQCQYPFGVGAHVLGAI